MEEHTAEKLCVPQDFTAPTVSGTIQKNLMPPSHFTSAAQPLGSLQGVQIRPAGGSWSAAAGLGATRPAAAWLAVSRDQGEVLELREENQRLRMLQGDTSRGRSHSSESSGRGVGGGGEDAWVRLEAEGRVRLEAQQVEAERLRGQLEALKESEERQRGELRDRDSTLHRQGAELETVRCDLDQTRARLDQVELDLQQNLQENQKISSQLETLEKESEEEIGRLRKEEARSRQEVQGLLREAEQSRREMEEQVKRSNLDLATQLEHLQQAQQTERQQLSASHASQLEAAAALARAQLQGRLDAVTAERDALREQLSRAGAAALEGQAAAAALHSLRGHIRDPPPGGPGEERPGDAVQKLSQEKEALQKTAELLSVRLKCVNEILALQEQKLLSKSQADPLRCSAGPGGVVMLRGWRERVFSLCVRLRTQELEMRKEREQTFSREKTLQQEVEQEQLRNTLLQHSLDDRRAQLHLEEVAVRSLKEDLAALGRENTELRAWKRQAGGELRTLTEALQRFSAAFEVQIAKVHQSQLQLPVLCQRLTFAKRRVHTIQGLLVRSAALQKVQHCSRPATQEDERVRRLQAELQQLSEEREELGQELRRTPDLIDKALAQLRETFGQQLKELQEEMHGSRGALAEALSSREEAQRREEEAQRREKETQAQLEETKARLEELNSQFLVQQEQSQQALWSAEAQGEERLREKEAQGEERLREKEAQGEERLREKEAQGEERLREKEAQGEERLREKEAQVNTAQREQTKAVMALRQLDRQVTREREQRRRDQQLLIDQLQQEIQDLQRRLRETETDRNLLLASGQKGHAMEVRRARHAASRPRHTTHATETLPSVLGEVKALSSLVVDDCEHEEKEEERQSV